MAIYLVTFDAVVEVSVEANSEGEADFLARQQFTTDDVILTDMTDIDLLLGDPEEERCTGTS